MSGEARVQYNLRPRGSIRKAKPKNILTWANHLPELEKLRKAAILCRDTDAALDASHIKDSFNALVNAIKRPELPNYEEARVAGIAQQELSNYHSYLAMDLGLNFHLVRSEWAPILNPHPAELKLCQRNLREERTRAGVN